MNLFIFKLTKFKLNIIKTYLLLLNSIFQKRKFGDPYLSVLFSSLLISIVVNMNFILTKLQFLFIYYFYNFTIIILIRLVHSILYCI